MQERIRRVGDKAGTADFYLIYSDMKNQYFGDINDYKKYGLLRIISEVTGKRIGVCWMLTEDDKGNDGKKIHYLRNHNEYRKYDPELFDHLRKVHDGQNRDIKNARIWNFLKNAKYCEKELRDNISDRERYFEQVRSKLELCSIIFFDPDNGLEVDSIQKGKKKSSKFIYYDELKDFISRRKAILIYQHFPREKREVYIAKRVKELNKELECGIIQAYRTSNVLFLLVLPRQMKMDFMEIEKRINNWKNKKHYLINRC